MVFCSLFLLAVLEPVNINYFWPAEHCIFITLEWDVFIVAVWPSSPVWQHRGSHSVQQQRTLAWERDACIQHQLSVGRVWIECMIMSLVTIVGSIVAALVKRVFIFIQFFTVLRRWWLVCQLSLHLPIYCRLRQPEQLSFQGWSHWTEVSGFDDCSRMVVVSARSH